MGKYVIVGNGVCGTRAAEVLRRKQPEAEITLLTDEAYPFYRRPQLADFAAGRVSLNRLWGKDHGFYEDQNIELRLSAPVTEVDPAAHTVRLAGGEVLPYDRLLIASGRCLRSADLPGSDLAGVNCFKTLDDAKSVRELEGRGRIGLVYGNGLIALELVRALTTAGLPTTYLVPTERLWPGFLDEDAAEICASRLRAAGAQVVYGAVLEAIEGQDGRAKAAVVQGGETYRGHVMGICTDYAPLVDFLPDDHEFQVGAGFDTPWEDVYAAGDVTMPPGQDYFNWSRSWRQGGAVAGVLAGESGRVMNDVEVLNMQVLGLSLVSIGQTVAPYRSGYSEMRGDYPYGEFYKKLVFDKDGILVGALLLGSIAEAGTLEEAIRRREHKEELDQTLLHQMFDVTYRTAYQGVQCPVCRHEVQLPRGAQEGDHLSCPICGVEFVLGKAPHGFMARLVK